MHTIRLRDPWESERIATAVRYRRRFGQPTNLGPGQRVWLVLAGVDRPAQIALNGQPLEPAEQILPLRFDITGQLVTRNELLLDVPGDRPLGDVRLEIED